MAWLTLTDGWPGPMITRLLGDGTGEGKGCCGAGEEGAGWGNGGRGGGKGGKTGKGWVEWGNQGLRMGGVREKGTKDGEV